MLPIRAEILASGLVLALSGCLEGASPPAGPAPAGALGALPGGNAGRIEVRRLDARPRLTLVSRDGDPSPAVAAVFVTGLGPALTTALAAVVEARLRAAGFDAELRVDRDAFRARVLVPDPGRVPALFATLATAAGRPVSAGSPEVALAIQRLQSLKRNPLDAVELAPIAACTGALGVTPGEALPDLAAEPGARELEAARRAALHVGNISLAAVGPATFAVVVAQALERTDGWPPPGAPPPEEVAAPDAAGAYTAPSLDRRSARLTLAARVADPALAAAAAERLGAADSPLAARLRLLTEPWRVVQVAGVARAHGGCVSAVLEMIPRAQRQPVEPGAAVAAVIARREIAAELAVGNAGSVVARQILTAAEPREAASRAAWWAMAAPAPAAPPRWSTALGVPALAAPPRDAGAGPAASARFQVEIDRASAVASGAERRLAAEHGQGELWVLLASPCGAAEEGTPDAGFGALAILAAIEGRRRPADVAIDPWITSDGLGVVAHASFRDERETSGELAHRVADAAARVLTATLPSPEAIAAARAALLDHLEHASGHQGTAFEAFAPALVPEHPSWVEPFGLWSRVAGAPTEGVRARAHALAWGPLRLAVIANTDAAQAGVAADAVDRWLSPAPGPRVCRAAASSASRAGRVEVHLASDAPLAQGLLGAAFPAAATPGAAYPYRDLADTTAAALDGPGGLLAGALAGAAATASARVMGGGRAPSLVVDVRAPDGSLTSAVSEVKGLLLRLPTAATEADLLRAAAVVERREHEALADPRRRLADLWSGRRGPAPGRPSLTAWRAFLNATLREPALVVVEAHTE
jgi:hypothetical protein